MNNGVRLPGWANKMSAVLGVHTLDRAGRNCGASKLRYCRLRFGWLWAWVHRSRVARGLK
jgi:hypothetical protein